MGKSCIHKGTPLMNRLIDYQRKLVNESRCFACGHPREAIVVGTGARYDTETTHEDIDISAVRVPTRREAGLCCCTLVAIRGRGTGMVYVDGVLVDFVKASSESWATVTVLLPDGREKTYQARNFPVPVECIVKILEWGGQTFGADLVSVPDITDIAAADARYEAVCAQQ